MIFAGHKIEGLVINLNKEVPINQDKKKTQMTQAIPHLLGICPRETSTRVHMEVWFKDVYYSTREKE